MYIIKMSALVFILISFVSFTFCGEPPPSISSTHMSPSVSEKPTEKNTSAAALSSQNIVFTEGGKAGIVTDDKPESSSASSSTKPTELTNNSKSVNATTPQIINNTMLNNTSSTSTSTEHTLIETVTHVHKTHSRKGVQFDNKTSTNAPADIKLNKTSMPPVTNASKLVSTSTSVPVSTSSTTPIPKKPTVLIGDDEPYAPSNFLPKGSKMLMKNNSKEKQSNGEQTLDSVTRKKLDDREPDYVIPVVITILSVPLIIGLGMLTYRLGAHWWDRRHYRRMDYLIEGMYNN